MHITVLSDLHLGHKRIPGAHIYQNLQTHVYPTLEHTDLVVFTGDTFHSLLDFNNDTSGYVIQFLNDLFYMSSVYHFGIRFLRGTFTHDRNQVQYIQQSTHKFLGDVQDVDLRTYSDIAIDEETIHGETLRLLYLPDDLPYRSSDDVLAYVQQLLDSRGWTDVDIVFGHGYFQHILPPASRGPSVCYTVESFVPICKHLVVFGHVHTPSIRGYKHLTTLYVGSFERMTHGEEEPKGYITIETDKWTVTRHVNLGTLLFLTYSPTADTAEDIVDRFKRWIESAHLSTEKVNYIRVIHPDPSIRVLLGKILRSEYLQYRCVYSAEAPRSESAAIVETAPITTADTELVVPTEDNIVEIITQFIKERQLTPLSKETISSIWQLQFEEDVRHEYL